MKRELRDQLRRRVRELRNKFDRKPAAKALAVRDDSERPRATFDQGAALQAVEQLQGVGAARCHVCHNAKQLTSADMHMGNDSGGGFRTVTQYQCAHCCPIPIDHPAAGESVREGWMMGNLARLPGELVLSTLLSAPAEAQERMLDQLPKGERRRLLRAAETAVLTEGTVREVQRRAGGAPLDASSIQALEDAGAVGPATAQAMRARLGADTVLEDLEDDQGADK